MYSCNRRSNSSVLCGVNVGVSKLEQGHRSKESSNIQTLAFLKADLFSLHHASASVQLCFRSAFSILRMSVNKSISTSFLQMRMNISLTPKS